MKLVCNIRMRKADEVLIQSCNQKCELFRSLKYKDHSQQCCKRNYNLQDTKLIGEHCPLFDVGMTKQEWKEIESTFHIEFSRDFS